MTAVPAPKRRRPPESAGEVDTLVGMLDFLRDTAVVKVAGLTDDQARTATVPPSTLTPAGVVKHLAATERWWFSLDFAAADLPEPWLEDDPAPGNFVVGPAETLAAIVTDYQEECARSRAVAAAAGLDDPARGADMHFNLRYAMVHMIEETARHCGHLDLLREAIDGSTGQ